MWLAVWRRERRLDLLSAGLLAGMFLAFFWPTVSGAVYQPADGGDLVSFLFPTYRAAARILSEGRLPLWNPYLYGGAPYIGDIQAGFLYPPNLLLFLLNPSFDYRWMQYLSLGHFWWAGLGVFVLVRTLGHSRPAALLAGLAFGLCDMLFIHFGNLNLIAVLSWSGWILTACHLMLTRRSLVWACAAAALFAVANYAGHAQSSYYVGMAVGLYSLAFLAARQLPSRAGALGRLRRFLVDLNYPFMVFVLTALLSAPLLLPAFEMLPFTQRAVFDYQDTVSYSLAPGPGLIGLLTPGFFGRGPWAYWGSWDRVELPYAGLVTLLLAAGAVLLPMPEKRRRLVPWVALALFGFLVALGSSTPLHGWLTRILPVYGSFQAPARTIVLWALALSALAGMGLDALLAGRQPGPKIVASSQSSLYFSVVRFGGPALLLVIVPLIFVATRVLHGDPVAFRRASMAGQAALLATAVWLALWLLLALNRRKRLKRGALAWQLPLLLLLELTAAAVNIDVGRNDPTAKFVHPEILAFLQREDAQGVACFPIENGRCQEVAAGALPDDTAQAAELERDLFRIDVRTGIYDLWQPNTAALVGLQDVWGIYNPLVLTHWQALWENNGGRHTRIYDMLNVRYVLVRDETPLPEEYILAYDAPGPLTVYENPDPLPRAWMVAGSRIVADEEAALAALQQPTFEPTETVVLMQDNAHALASESPPARVDGPVSILSYNNNEILLAADADRRGFLVLSEVWYPGWQATVNGENVPVLRANYTLRALPVPAGNLSIRLWYAPQSWRRGLALFGVGLLLLAGLLFWARVGGRSQALQKG